MVVRLEPVSLPVLTMWREADLSGALRSFRRSATDILGVGRALSRGPEFANDRSAWERVARKAADLETTAASARRFFEDTFLAFRIVDEERPAGLFTGYYEAQGHGSRTRTSRYRFPVYARPRDLVRTAASTDGEGRYGRSVNGTIEPYSTRAEIDAGALDGRADILLWLDSAIDLYFIHIQGSGRVILEDGSVVRIAYTAKNGRPYTSIGASLIGDGLFTPATMSMQTLRRWLGEDEARAMATMQRNASYVFFRELSNLPADLGPPGAQEVGLEALVSLAVDRRYWPLGMPVWLDTATPKSDGSSVPFRKLMVAQDTGSAIRGGARGDIFFGAGDEAAYAAGHMKAPGAMVVLLPRPA
jgi:membrane-bound lytic murein transglycosylase A